MSKIYTAAEAEALANAAVPGPWFAECGFHDTMINGEHTTADGPMFVAAGEDGETIIVLEVEDEGSGPLIAAAPDLARSVAHHAQRADAAEAEAERLRARVAEFERPTAGRAAYPWAPVGVTEYRRTDQAGDRVALVWMSGIGEWRWTALTGANMWDGGGPLPTREAAMAAADARVSKYRRLL